MKAIQVKPHESLDSVCFFVHRTDGSKEDFSYRKVCRLALLSSTSATQSSIMQPFVVEHVIGRTGLAIFRSCTDIEEWVVIASMHSKVARELYGSNEPPAGS